MRNYDIVSRMMNTVASKDVPHGRLDQRPHQMHSIVILAAYRAGSANLVTVKTTLDQWLDLPPVQYVVKTELSRQQPRRPTRVTGDDATTVPRGTLNGRTGRTGAFSPPIVPKATK
jgi:hypothetical protein